MRTIGIIAFCAIVGSLSGGCSENDDTPGITRIDGPAVVDADRDGEVDG